jgi:hypothetical protein
LFPQAKSAAGSQSIMAYNDHDRNEERTGTP